MAGTRRGRAAGAEPRTRVVVTGATGNVGTSRVRALSADPTVTHVTAIARRLPSLALPKVRWEAADVAAADLADAVRGADVVVHLAWVIQPSHDEPAMRRINVGGTERVANAVGATGVPTLIHASSVGAYSPGPRVVPVDEGWPTDGIPTSFYARHKAEAERILDRFEAERPSVRVVRMRPSLTFKREMGIEARRLFLGPLFPPALLRPGLVPVVPLISGLRFQCAHTDDVAEAYRLAIRRDVRGPFNLAAAPIVSMRDVAALLGARTIGVSSRPLRLAAELAWRARLQPTPPGWLDVGMDVPMMSTARAEEELGWRPRATATQALAELLEGIREQAGDDTPPLARAG
jgi:UDP-glucose 4-epimerase